MSADNPRLAAALQYAAAGWHVLPVWEPLTTPPGAARGCACPQALACPHPGKHPRTTHGYKDASRDPVQLAAWWMNVPHANVGVATGVQSEVAVLDVDGPAGK